MYFPNIYELGYNVCKVIRSFNGSNICSLIRDGTQQNIALGILANWQKCRKTSKGEHIQLKVFPISRVHSRDASSKAVMQRSKGVPTLELHISATFFKRAYALLIMFTKIEIEKVRRIFR